MKYLERLGSRSLLLDAALALTIFVGGMVGRFEFSDMGIPFTSQPDALNAVLIAMMSLPLVLRRVFPVTVFVLVILAWGVDRALDYPATLATAGVVVAFHTLGTELPRRRSQLIGGTAVLAVTSWTVLGAIVLESVGASSVVAQLLITGGPLHLGREVHERRRKMEELAARAEQAERDREEIARRAVEEERARIARELHDVVAHQMTVMTLQAEGARRVANGADPRVLGALDTIKDTGHAALTEMRRVVGLLRGSQDNDPDLTPLPRLDDLGALVSQIRSAGVPVDLELRGETRSLAESVELSAYRIIQESLTNVVRHGGPEVSADVVVDYGDVGLEVIVTDNGRGLAAPPHVERGGQGLVGMKERVAVLGGTIDTGANPGGGYRVHVRIPYQT